MTDHRHTWTVDSTEDAPEGVNGRKINMACATCPVTRSTITLRTDKEIQYELDAYNAQADDDDDE